MREERMIARWMSVAFLALAAPACSERHLNKDFGSSYRAAFEAQAPPRPGGPARPATGLDAQEASIVTQTYRTSLAPKDTKPRDQPVLIVAPPAQGGAQKLAPSVPQER
jgi:hypothetical protein